jgi:hypothetical protein
MCRAIFFCSYLCALKHARGARGRAAAHSAGAAAASSRRSCAAAASAGAAAWCAAVNHMHEMHAKLCCSSRCGDKYSSWGPRGGSSSSAASSGSGGDGARGGGGEAEAGISCGTRSVGKGDPVAQQLLLPSMSSAQRQQQRQQRQHREHREQ